ncbi:hypothetical protein WJX81_002839 [Elliptochloris bilobata]|uniref:NADH:ubiquinone reductase (non-electrogenic) n=1 Tax=Elliptochloris bilobata TaxID=381761 RepID=A0AAW1RZV6_9CHLO
MMGALPRAQRCCTTGLQVTRVSRLPRAKRQAWNVCSTLTTERPPTTDTSEEKPAAPTKELPVYHSGTSKPRVVVLGSGWGAMSFLKSLPRDAAESIDLTLISPRNYFLYTPLLPAVATGTVEERSIVEPVRRVLKKKGKYFEAICNDIDPVERSLVACFPPEAGLDEACFKVPYDMLVLAVGSSNNTFGIKGVEDHCFFFRSITNANELRRRVSECFERAALPQSTSEERKKLLSFVVVGGGPTGVEVAAELHDMVRDDLVKVYPDLIKDVRIRVIELMDHVLSTYDRAISDYTANEFSRGAIELVLNSRVAGVRKGEVDVINTTTNTTEVIPFGACVWSTGVAMHPLIKKLQGKLPGGTQTHFRSIVTDEYLRVIGSEGTIFSIGDAATIAQGKALAKAKDLFWEADKDGNGVLSLGELRDMLRAHSREYSHFAEHARFLDGKYGASRWGGMVASAVSRGKKPVDAVVGELTEDTALEEDQFRDLLEKIDRGLRALPATAQVAKQQGEFLAALLGKGAVRQGSQIPADAKPFKYSHKGSLAYVGSDKAVMDVPTVGPIFGWGAGLMWKGFETYSQISFRNIFLVSLDWIRTKIFGRDISRV